MKALKIYIYFLAIASIAFSQPITPIPLHVEDVNPAKVKLGKQLFFDPILSKNDTIACTNCHILNDGGDDNLKHSFGIDGKEGNINSPTVFNARYNFVQFWNGRAKDLQAQASGPIENPVEMGNNFPNLIKTLNNTPYKKEFEAIYKDGVTKNNITDALSEYEKTLITPNSPFDRYLRGDKKAINGSAKRGYELFLQKGCIACHNGVNIGGSLYNKFGYTQSATSNNTGRYAITHDIDDKYFFKVPSLRNIAKTAPYLHDGRYNTLDETVKFMLKYQLGKTSTQKEVDDIVSFLNSLTGKIPKEAIK
ncbi:MAG: cytochrome-c peroxidase [Campylobacteraceae bacterium]|nr:cytochrome-c peroxidase [Campylobacteraceae bacterium]